MTVLMIEAAVRAMVFAIAVGAGLRLLRVSNVPVRKAAWSLVLVASLAMPFLMRWPAMAAWTGRVGWAVPIRMNRDAAPQAQMPASVAAPVILATVDEGKDSTPADTAVAPGPLLISAAQDARTVTIAPTGGIPSQPKFHWPATDRLIALVYLTVAGALLMRLLWGLAVALRLWMTADLVSPLVAPEPNVRSSSRVPSPVTIGSGIVLPANYTEWDMKKLRMVLAHERSHVRQMDFYLQLLAGLYTALFWFSPLGWWLRRTLASLGEAIGDRAGIDVAASRSRYAEVLLEFAAMPRQTLPGVAMARPGNLTHRIERLLNEHLFRSAFAEGRRRAVVSLLLIPAALFAATALIRVQSAVAQTAPAPATAPTPSVAPAPSAPTVPSAAPTPAAAPDGQAPPDATPEQVQDQSAPPAPGAPTPPPPMTAAPPAPGEVSGMLSDGNSVTVRGPGANIVVDGDDIRGYAYHFSENGDSYAIIDGSDDNITFSGEWSGDRKAELEAARKVAKGPFLWFTHAGKSYVVTDPAIIAKIRAMYKPMEALGQQQEALGKQQEALGKQQEELGREQEAAGAVRMPDLSKEMAELNAAVAKAKEAQDKWDTKQLAEAEANLKAAQNQMLTPEKVAELQEKLAAAQDAFSSERMAEMQERLGELQARLGELEGKAGERQGEFGEKMGELGAREGKLGDEQGRLGEEQGRLARQADQQVRSIIDQTLHNGKATQVPAVEP
jgi:hypothetical protein